MSPLERLDSGQPPDGGGGLDGGSTGGCDAGPALGACAAAYAGCSSYVDLTAAGANVVFGGTQGDTYSPACILIRSGQTVTFSGDFTAHPLNESCGPSSVFQEVSQGSTASFTFCATGTYGYYCRNHGTVSGNGMAGAIQVVP